MPTTSTPSCRAKVSDFFELDGAGGPRFEGHQADGAFHGRNIGVAFAFKAGEDAGDRDAEIGEASFELGGPLRGARPGMRSVQMDRMHAEVAGNL